MCAYLCLTMFAKSFAEVMFCLCTVTCKIWHVFCDMDSYSIGISWAFGSALFAFSRISDGFSFLLGPPYTQLGCCA